MRQSVERGVEGVADVDDDLAGEGVTVLGDNRDDACVQQGCDDDVSGRDGAPGARRRAAAQSLGQVVGLGLIAAHDLDGVAAGHSPGADRARHVARTDEGDAAHVCVLSLFSGVAQRAVVPPSATSSRPLT